MQVSMVHMSEAIDFFFFVIFERVGDITGGCVHEGGG